ncbi:nuclear body protein SP140-like protein isoform X1 [Desmodus rotundus]|uniref:nuclear body protein SP140-like protein isoform X1 n=2 Tax=Desmodus rotundus TaxID=9430 RepID=UPI00238120E8|nr:nuclear body protein SP140-like protein isoform X1 [Desmodus rotundus]
MMMATEHSDLSTRMSTKGQIYNSIKETAGKIFKKYKVEISHAVKSTFPFLELLRDREFITNDKYEQSLQNSTKRITVEEVIYDTLTDLEDTFDLPLLAALFSKAIMEKFPDLKDIYKVFKNEIPNIQNFLENAVEKGQSDNQLSLEQGTGENSYPSLSWSGPHPWNDIEQLPEREEINVMVDRTTDNNDALESQQANEQCAQQSDAAELPNRGIPVNSGPTDPENIKKEKPFFNSGVEWEAQGRTDCNQASEIIEINSEDSAERRYREEPPEGSTSAVKRKPGTVDPVNNSTPEKAKRKRRTEQQPAVPVNFEAEILPVTCKEKMGLLIKRKLERGATRKCIRTEDGNWFTPREFEVRGGKDKASNWKTSLTCGRKTLKQLIELGFIQPPPNAHDRKKKVENSDKCEICQDGGKLFRCTCRKFFHGGCHIPPVETERNGWKCTFCTAGKPPSQQQHRESEVLMKLMGPEEELKCAFLLLKVYGPLESKVFPNIPHENYVEEASRCLEKLRELDLIKKSLIEGKYTDVKSFALAMDNFFTIPSCNDAELTKDDFKKNFKKQFAIRETH